MTKTLHENYLDINADSKKNAKKKKEKSLYKQQLLLVPIMTLILA